MTEREWLTSKDPAGMMARLQTSLMMYFGKRCFHQSERKLRLVGLALYDAYARRRMWEVIDQLEADRRRDLRFIDDAHTTPGRAYWNLYILPPKAFATKAVTYYTAAGIRPVRFVTPAGRDGNRARVPLDAAARLIRDIVGNPYKPVRDWRPHPHFLDNELRGLAEAAYTEHVKGHLDPQRLGVLADALEDAGCVHEELLMHLRGMTVCTADKCKIVPGSSGGRYAAANHACACGGSGWVKDAAPHVPGCHAVDLVLGKK